MKSKEFIINEINKAMAIKPQNTYEYDIKMANICCYFRCLDIDDMIGCSLKSLKMARQSNEINADEYIYILLKKIGEMAEIKGKTLDIIKEYCDIKEYFHKVKDYLPLFVEESMEAKIYDIYHWLEMVD